MRSLPLARSVLALVVLLLAAPVVRAWVATEDPEPDEGPPELVITGRFLLPDGSPAVGAHVQFNGWSQENEREGGRGLPDLEGEPSTETDGHGEFVLRTDPSGADGVSVAVRLEGYARRFWLYPGVPDRDEPLDLGTTTLEPAGSLRVRVVDGAGKPHGTPWSLFLVEDTEPHMPMQGVHVCHVDLQPSEEGTLVTGLPAGEVRIIAVSAAGPRIEPPSVRIVAGETAATEIVHEGEDLGRRITVRLESDPFPVFSWEVADVRAIAPDGEPIEADYVEPNWLLRDLDPEAEYTLHVEKPGFEEWRKSGVRPGTSVVAFLRPDSGVRLSVVDADTGARVDDYELSVQFDRANMLPNEFTLRGEHDAPAEGGVYRLPRRPCTLRVEAAGCGIATHSIEDFTDGGIRPVEIRVSPARALHGRVVQNDGETGVPDVTVHLRPAGESLRTFREGWSNSGRKPIAILRTDEEGRFEVDVGRGTYALHAIRDAWLTAAVDPVEVPRGGRDEEVLLRLPPTGSLEGRLLGGDPARLAGLVVRAIPTAEPLDYILASETDGVLVEPDGRFTVPLLPLGGARLLLSERTPSDREGGSFDYDGFHIEIGEVSIGSGVQSDSEFDLADRWPSSVSVKLELDGEPAEGYVLHLLPKDDSHRRADVEFDAAGFATMRCVEPGAYAVRVGPRYVYGGDTPGWDVALDDHLVLAPDDDVVLEESLRLVTARVQLVAAETGAPLANRYLSLRFVEGTDRVGPTDDDGRLELTLPPGEFLLVVTTDSEGGRGGDATMRSALLRWTDAGPSTPRIEFRSRR